MSKLFDANDSFDIMADKFRRDVSEIALRARKITIYREMDADDQLRCFLAGAICGLVSIAMASVDQKNHDMILTWIHAGLATALMEARKISEELLKQYAAR